MIGMKNEQMVVPACPEASALKGVQASLVEELGGASLELSCSSLSKA